ncbi:MAG: hypothetical protein AAGE52_17125 [Myxococcota bacterium]
MSEVDGVWAFPFVLPRHAFSVRDAARAGDIWRAFQEVAVEGSSRSGWPPLRYRAEGVAFVVRTMTVEHGLEALYGEQLTGRTWVRRFRREMFSTREVRLTSPRGVIAKGTQEWVHVSQELVPTRARQDFIDAFQVVDIGDGGAELPKHDGSEGPEHIFRFEAWWTWMDPLDHANHPAYIDWCDEGISRVMVRSGLAPVQLRPRAERVTYSRGVVAGEEVSLTTRRLGLTPERDVVFAHEVRKDDILCARATTVRTLASGDPETLAAAFA